VPSAGKGTRRRLRGSRPRPTPSEEDRAGQQRHGGDDQASRQGPGRPPPGLTTIVAEDLDADLVADERRFRAG
jgi:hypothetical protein